MVKPHTIGEQNDLILLHKKAVDIYLDNPTSENQAIVHDIFEKIMSYENVLLYNKYARNTCKFSNSIVTSGCCEKKFKNTFRHYCANGNCCQSCSNYFSALVKPIKKTMRGTRVYKAIPNFKVDLTR